MEKVNLDDVNGKFYKVVEVPSVRNNSDLPKVIVHEGKTYTRYRRGYIETKPFVI